jgi:hypothetical protein
MQCPKCQTELGEKPAPESRPSERERSPRPGADRTASTPEESYRADAPPGPCPKCGWSTMWNE